MPAGTRFWNIYPAACRIYLPAACSCRSAGVTSACWISPQIPLPGISTVLYVSCSTVSAFLPAWAGWVFRWAPACLLRSAFLPFSATIPAVFLPAAVRFLPFYRFPAPYRFYIYLPGFLPLLRSACTCRCCVLSYRITTWVPFHLPYYQDACSAFTGWNYHRFLPGCRYHFQVRFYGSGSHSTWEISLPATTWNFLHHRFRSGCSVPFF